MGDTSVQGLSDGQEKLLSLLYLCSSTLSMVGSSTITYKVFANRRKATSYDRLMFGLSICDIISSIAYSLYPFFLPKETSPRVWAIGSDATCSVLGFLTQLGFAAALYNAFLSFYYVLTIRYGMDRKFFAKRYEVLMHLFGLSFCFFTALVGSAKGFYSEVQVGFGCWVNDYPRGCTDDCLSTLIGGFYGGIPLFFSLLAMMINHVLVYLHVRTVFKTDDILVSERILRQKMQKKEVATQGFLYVGCFVFCFWPALVVRAIEAFNSEVPDESGFFILLVFQAGALPLQGFLNMFIYNRPNYNRVRRAYPELSILASLRMACFDSEIPKLIEITKLSGSAPNMGKYKSSSGAAFSSNLVLIQEGSNEDESSRSSRSGELESTTDNEEDYGLPSPRGERDSTGKKGGTKKTAAFTESSNGLVGESNTNASQVTAPKSTPMRIEMDGSVASTDP